jgi:Ala-tRNA(Pro) deacylase
MSCKSRIEDYLRENGVPFEAIRHPSAFTAQELAAAQGVPGKQFAKVVMAVADGQVFMLVLPACHRINFDRLKRVLRAEHVRLATEEEFSVIFPDCSTGAMPPFGHLYGVPVYVDRGLSEGEHMVFQAGTHDETIKTAYKDYERVTKPVVAAFAEHA